MEATARFTFWTPRRTRRISLVMLLALVAAHIIVLIKDVENTSSVRRGDFPAFYAAASIVSSGAGSRLYDQELQQQVENKYWPSLKGNYLSFAYPPYVALLLSPLSLLPPLPAKLLYSVLLIASLIVTVLICRRLTTSVAKDILPLFVVFFSFGPVLSGLAAAQNITISMCLYAASIYFILKQSKWGDIAAGLILGVWLFKPNLSLLAVFYLFLARKYRVVSFAFLPAVGYYLLGTLVSGPEWPIAWREQAEQFSIRDLPTNQFQMVSIRGALSALIAALDAGSISARGGVSLLGWALWAVVFFLTAIKFFNAGRVSTSKKLSNEICPLEPALYLLAPALVLLSPHTLYYDLGLCLIAGARYLVLRSDRQVTVFIAFLFIVFLLTLGREMFFLQPLVILPLACFVWLFSKGK